ncbi:MAG: organoarsenical effux MFS transporter ArsJ [Pontibacterium sp.]
MFSKAWQQYLVVTGNYWAFTLTDGALRMLVVLHFYSLGYGALAIAMLFLFYEFFGVVTNLVGGWLGARWGLNRTMQLGLGLQLIALGMLLVPEPMLTVIWVMAAQALSGIAKDLNKMSAKSAIKTLVPADASDKLLKWVALLTGSKNALKGVGFFVGALLLSLVGFSGAVLSMLAVLAVIWLASFALLTTDLGQAKRKPKFKEIFSKSRAVNRLSAARLFLFAARDVWFVVAVPVFMSEVLGWDHWLVGSFMACWVIGYGVVQASSPAFILRITDKINPETLTVLAALLVAAPMSLLFAILTYTDLPPMWPLVIGLVVFGLCFALNSALHSFLIVHYADQDGVSMDVGFYYMANAAGRLLGTVLSGWLYQTQGLAVCVMASVVLLVLTALISLRLPTKPSQVSA